jgi:tetratricopeptide (TPR) repeat protein
MTTEVSTRPHVSNGKAGMQATINELESPGQAVLAAAQAGRFIIQDFCPLAQSLEWDLGQQYLRLRGTKAFIEDASPVPFVVNNDGTLSRNAAEVFFASLVAGEQSSPLEEHLFVLELGIGVGLFARFFLDAFQALCRQHGKDYYDRLCYIAADRSEPMLQDACLRGVFANHLGHVLVRRADALEPERELIGDVALAPYAPRPFRAVFLNYLLDCLPAADLKVTDEEVRQLYVRTCLARNVDLREFTDLTPQELGRRAASPDPRDQQSLLELYGLLAAEYDYFPVAVGQLPYGEFALAFSKANTGHLLHNFGAIQSLERLLALLHPQGIILANDYGQTEVSRGDDFEHQRFSHATFVGINFPLLKAYFADGGKCQWVEPLEDNGRIHSRLLGHTVPAEVAKCFAERFSKAAYNWLQQPLDHARACLQAGRFEAALTAYHQALARQPSNWLLMDEIALFLTFTLRNPLAGVDMAQVALTLNPGCSSELWNTFGDCLFELGRVDEARHAYQRALAVNPADIKARYNLTWVFARLRAYDKALAMIAEGLALDQTGEYYERLVKKQSEILGRLAQRHQQQNLMLANRVSRKPRRDGRPGAEDWSPGVPFTAEDKITPAKE